MLVAYIRQHPTVEKDDEADDCYAKRTKSVNRQSREAARDQPSSDPTMGGAARDSLHSARPTHHDGAAYCEQSRVTQNPVVSVLHAASSAPEPALRFINGVSLNVDAAG